MWILDGAQERYYSGIYCCSDERIKLLLFNQKLRLSQTHIKCICYSMHAGVGFKSRWKTEM